MTASASAGRPGDAVRAASGLADLLATRATARTELGSEPTRGDVRVYRVLGARQVLQAWLTRRSGLRSLGAAVDALHLATMLPVAVLSPRWRRAALVQSALAVSLIVAAFRNP